MGGWPLTARRSGIILLTALATIYIANATGLRQRILG